MNDLLVQFVAEARELLQQADEDLLALERTPDDEVAINRLFRSVHTLKGSSGLFETPPLTEVLHAAEDLFQAVRERTLTLTPEMVDLALKTIDQFGLWIDALDQNEALPDDARSISKILVAELRDHYHPNKDVPPAKAAVATQENPVGPAPDLRQWFREDELVAAGAAAGEETVHHIHYRPDEGCFFRGEDPLHLVLQIPQLQALSAGANEPWAALSELDPFVCNIGFHALSTAGRAEIEALFRYVLDEVTITERAVSSLRGLQAHLDPPETLPEVVVRLLRGQIDLLSLSAPVDEMAGRIAAAASVAANALRFAGRTVAATVVETLGAKAVAEGGTERLSVGIAAALRGEPSTNGIAKAASLAMQAGGTDPPEPVEIPERIAARTLRVDQEKIDALMNLIGELVVAKNSLPFLARRAEQHFGSRELGREIGDQFGVIDRIAQELQGAVMAVRMMPVSQVFQRFPRLVRDLSRKLGKDIALVIEGEETEADKNVIESLFDPLLHMVRNSLDHGIELPGDRITCGKPATATIKLVARHDGDQVVIEIIDDGRGIDPEIIKHKAYEKGLIDEARLLSISDDEATMLVFAPGFSTAAAVSDVSGRGVGMDVVRNAVEKAGGKIDILSVKGAGTTVRLHLPLSMAVSRVMTVSLGDRLFGIPMELIHGTTKVPCDEIISIKGHNAFVLRERVVPLLRLARLLALPDEPAAAEVAVLVVHLGGQTIGLQISAFGDSMEVILKPLEGMLAKIDGYSGTALLGDGHVLLVLDLKELIP